MMGKAFFALAVVFLLSIGVVSAHGEETFAEAEEIIELKTPCSQLTDDQLDAIGDYYMEQMHPGEAHEAMDEMMGGEGSESLRQMHINMAKSFYCGENDAMPSGMMDMMMGRNTGMMNGGMMGSENMAAGMIGFGTGTGMMGAGMGFLGLFYFALGALIFSAIFWLMYNLIADKKKK